MASSSRMGRLLHPTSSSSSSHRRPLTGATTLTPLPSMPTRPGIRAGILPPANISIRRSIMQAPPRGMGTTRGHMVTTTAAAGGMAGMAREGRRALRGVGTEGEGMAGMEGGGCRAAHTAKAPHTANPLAYTIAY